MDNEKKVKPSRLMFRSTDKSLDDVDSKGAKLHHVPLTWLTILKEADRALTRDECVEALSRVTVQTKQPAIRHIYYWKKYLITEGWLTTETVSKKARLPVVSEPAPTAPSASEDSHLEPASL